MEVQRISVSPGLRDAGYEDVERDEVVEEAAERGALCARCED
jgi:hypothetical protein